MAKRTPVKPVFVQWTKQVPAADVQDPLGTSLRGSTRIANRLLFCITSITPRARYFAFIPWCVDDYDRHERGHPYALGLREAIALRERALTLGCVVHHDGAACAGGGLVGSRQAVRWWNELTSEVVNLRKLKLAKNPALDAYFNSLVNLGVFVTEEELPEVGDDEEPVKATFDDIELSELGQELAGAYRRAVGRLSVIADASSANRETRPGRLERLGERGGLCELALPTSPDRAVLRDIFFTRRGIQDGSHAVRRQSLLLQLDTAKRLASRGCPFDEASFAQCVYFGEVNPDGQPIKIDYPSALGDIATRWGLFYFHYYMALSLEAAFRWLVTHLRTLGLAGETAEGLVGLLGGPAVCRDVEEVLGSPLGQAFSQHTPASLFGLMGTAADPTDAKGSRAFDAWLRTGSAFSECALEQLLRNPRFSDPASGFAFAMTLLASVLARYKQWQRTPVGDWLASVSNDPYLDLVPPVVLGAVERRFDRWWSVTFEELAAFVLGRFVVQQHQSMSYEKTASGSRCLLQMDNGRLTATGEYDKIGIGNARLGSAVQVLIDLGLLEQGDDTVLITEDGTVLLAEELECGAGP